MVPGVFPENLRQIERETDFLKQFKQSLGKKVECTVVYVQKLTIGLGVS